MSLLTIVQGAALRVGLPQPASAIGSPDSTVLQLIAAAQDSGDDFTERWTWLWSKKASNPANYTGDGTTTLFNLPTDFGKLSPSDKFVSSVYPTLTLRGPINEDELLRLKALPFVPVPAVWRRIGTQLEFYPAPAAAEIISFVYSSNQWITNSGGTPYATPAWTADTDLSRINERLIMLSTVWRWKRGKGLDYAEEFNTAERVFDVLAGQENTERTVAMAADPVPTEDWYPGTISYTPP